MNSLSELNTYAEEITLPYTDLRAPNVTFASDPINQTQITDEGFPFDSSVGIEITEIINAGQSQPSYVIDVSSLPGSTVSWTSLPSGVTSSVVTTGIYKVTGMSEVSDWDAVKSATITMPANYFGVWSYSSQIEYYSGADGNQIRRWTTAVTVNDVQFLTTPLEFVYAKDTVNNITNTPQIVNLDTSYPGVTWTVTVTPTNITSIDTFTTTGTGGTFTVNGTTKVITISGTRTQVNSRLAGLQLDSNSNSIDFALTYYVTNSLNSTTDTKSQLLSSVGLIYLGAVGTPTFYFTEDASEVVVTGAPLITDTSYDGSGGYTYTVTPSNTAAISNLRSIGSTGFDSFNSTTKVLTITGTRAQVNSRIATLRMVTSVDWGSDFVFTYSVVTPRYDTASKIQVIACGSNDTEVANMNISRTYIANNANIIFTNNTPSISDFDTSESTYTINFSVSSSLGLFSFSDTETPVTSLSFSGTRAQCNAKFASVRFWPAAGVSSNGSFTYTQLKNGVQQVQQTVSLLGSAGAYSGARSFIITTSGNWVPTVADALYGKVSAILLVGGGGGGAGGWVSPYNGAKSGGQGGNGGGVRYVATPMDLVVNQAYPVTIGAGGAGGSATGSTPALRVGGAGGNTSGFGYSIAGGGGATYSGGTVTKSGPGIGSSYQDDNGYGAGTDGTGGAAGGGGHISVNKTSGGTGGNGTSTGGGRGGYGFDEPNGPNSFWGAGGGGGGASGGLAGISSAAGNGASATTPPTSGTYVGGGGGGGGGYGSFAGAAGNQGCIKLKIVAK